MKLKLQIITLLLLGCSLTLRSQVITVNPAFPKSSDAVVITFNADKGDMGLKDYAGDDIYAHTGVITDKSTSGSDWKYIVALWGTFVTKAKMIKVSDNVYTLTISPSIRDFYGVPSTDKILKLAFVFRNSALTGTATGRDVGGADIFYSVSETPVFEVRLTQPDKYTSIVNAGDIVTIQASASMGDSLILLQNNARLVKVTGLTASHSLTAAGSGLFKIVARAWEDLVMKEDSVFYYIKPPMTVEEVPAGMDPGVNITGDNSGLFLLYAPGKDNVFVTGDFNNWLFSDEGYMKKSPDGQWFWLVVNGLDPSKEYAFQYVIDGAIRIPDPYTTKVLDPWNDRYITSATYPGLKAYPEGLAEGLVSAFRTRPPQYSWKNTSFTTPAKEDLVIYELLVRDFVAAHNFNTIRDTLAYFSRLGVNAIELMPVTEFDGNSSWGYNPAMYFALDKYYGTSDSFKELIDSCHSRGIAVIMDMVLNHAYGNNPLVKMYFNSTDNKPSADNPWFNVNSPNPAYSWGYDFNHESIATQAFVDSVCSYWITEFRVDGFRFDFSKGFTNTPGDGWAYDASRIAVLKRMGDKIWSNKPAAHLILEHFADNSEETVLANYGFMLWGDTKRDYLEASMGYSSDLAKASYITLGWSRPGLVTYMESHDEERMMFKNINYGASSPGYDIKDFKTALKRAKLAAAFFFIIPGPKMIWQFEELGYDYTIGTGDAKLSEKPIRWDFYNMTDRRNVFDNFKALIDLKKRYETFSSNNFTLYQVGKIKRLNVEQAVMDAVVFGNFDVVNGNINGNFT
ncbi:MAG TPA: alpha-amylase family glycosyl hydrolase, partial [Bacteroidales bacterium]|nr:alpha-amylase family glycosyl hydrolase [Bacteroidales bacterium]